MNVNRMQIVAETICKKIDCAWIAGECHPVEFFLHDRLAFGLSPEEQQALVIRLIHQEVELRRKKGQTPSTAEYADRFPGIDRKSIEEVMQLPVLPRQIRFNNGHAKVKPVRTKRRKMKRESALKDRR